MIICSNCGVELEPDMEICPLCETPVNGGIVDKRVKPRKTGLAGQAARMTVPQKKATWELTSIILVLSIAIMSLIDFIISREISWSEYPISVCMTIFSYITIFSFVEKRRELQMVLALITAALLIFTLDSVAGGNDWALHLGIPILIFVNVFFIGWLQIIRSVKQRGINLIAFTFLLVTLLCICIEGIVDMYLKDQINLIWSLIVGACALPVSIVLLFMHYRMKKGRDLDKTFHI